MTASWLHLIPFLCLFCAALSSQEKTAVVWRRPGGAFTIECRPPEPDCESLTVRGGIKKSDVVFKNSDNQIIKKQFKGRLEINGVLPNLDILIKNLTSDDTGPYWCFYTKSSSASIQEKEGKGSVLLVVSSETADAVSECTPSIKDSVLVSIVIAAVVLCCILIGFIIWVITIKTLRTTQKPQRVASNDVYEDMRGTLRR